MRTDNDTTRIVRSWLEEGVTALPDRVLDTVLDQLPATPQRRSWWPSRRFVHVNKFAQAAIAAAAVVVVSVVGYNLIPRTGAPGAQTAAPQSPSPTARPMPAGGAIEPGRYFWTVSGVRVTVEVPSGWVADPLGMSKSSEFAWGPVVAPFDGVYGDACQSDGALKDVGPSAAELATALEEQIGTAAVVTTVDVGGLAATRIDLAADAGLDRTKCSGGAEGPLKIWRHPGEGGYFALAPGYTGTVVTFDAGGTRLVFAGAKEPAAPAADIAELDAMIDSMVIEP